MVTLDLRRLRFLREFEVRGTLGAVATALGYSPSAISQQLTLLEKETGATLFEKSGRGVRLTDAGRLLASHAGLLLTAADAAMADLAAQTDFVRGTVRLSGLQSAARRLLVPAVARLALSSPGIRAEVRELEVEQALPELRLGSVDLLISDEYDGHPRPRPAGLRFALLHTEPLKLVLPVSHPLAAAGSPVPIAALRDEVWTTSDPGTGHHAMVVGTCRSLGGFDPDLRHRCYDAEVQLELVRQAGAVALLPLLTLPASDPAVAFRDVAEQSLGRRLYVVTREGPEAPALTAFLAALGDVASSLRDSDRDPDPRDAPAGRAEP
ncbi:DNA-binding transcriptional LysR family regulator [Actinoplanes lutulentus]|uniref:DNA-binding transcriptional LysR family regulator n=1 Tax=Actinoplanes lutulentus TaxID=1287878 RepID=A0A327ZJF7_9ACTN|nr:LysR family transcriptional regulator [Actinoplanes lutulentus]MBB2940787.1 DNA-binding transcriptional LysR family regulator [Actinoplanes lutulentus]RAK43097.1 DNA-binding transcriptional LysR family regulator [Actinoplanes lutulentus]